MLTLTLKPREERRLRDGHLWAFRDELVAVPQAEPGELVRLVAHDGSSLGTGFYNPLSKIAVRLLGGEVEVADADFFYRRFTSSKALRERFLGREEAYRLVFGEADMLSGLIVDVYGQTIVIQMLSAGMDRRKAEIVDALRRLYPDVSGIIEQSHHDDDAFLSDNHRVKTKTKPFKWVDSCTFFGLIGNKHTGPPVVIQAMRVIHPIATSAFMAPRALAANLINMNNNSNSNSNKGSDALTISSMLINSRINLEHE